MQFNQTFIISSFFTNFTAMNNRTLFLSHVGQTSTAPLALEIIRAHGSCLVDATEKEYIDLIGGISVCNIGHCHPKVIEAIKHQVDQYMHIMVYGELIQSPQVQYAYLLSQHLPNSLNTVFFTASGSEATEGAMKLAKRSSNRTQIISFKHSYHGSTQGALSIMGDEYWRNAFRPLLPDILQLRYNSIEDLEQITTRTACVIAETIQAEAGVIVPDREWIKALRDKCTTTGTLLVLDEIQCGFGRNGSLWAFEQFDIVPDILLLGKALGGGMPLGAFVADKKIMDTLSHNPVLGHINTFGGHPVCCAAGLAAFKVLLEENIVDSVKEKESLFVNTLTGIINQLPNPEKIQVRSKGLMIALVFESFEINKSVIDALIASADGGMGVFTDWFLFASNCLRIAPPLNISESDILQACDRIGQVILSMPELK